MYHHIRFNVTGALAIFEEIERQHRHLTPRQRLFRESLRRKVKRGIQWLTECPAPGAEGRCPGHEKEA